mmetsp:Transcript_4246/g.5001  ORF Transcript_4246/g.5001 Transcript_4246/m.5001 type:complete len:358 (-) Transcript_4246:447-1520(-)|eukprot:CAMPEP_0185753340 /NCGR_PEP_ID=MMETSP1174-20130828/12058_1 /TAXON_ID=35687 /ORGANISM="Dictyocha speculum, Strain CCMP1381" /LENGTH=357 /DNA_ID=CAMNT_0028431131 /DNA_START=95 /DNA_END=1168 /DNA_ORIENTATION=+
MPRTKSTPVRHASAAAEPEPEPDLPPLSLRLRSSRGAHTLSGMTGGSTLADLRGASEALFGGTPLLSLSFRGENMRAVTLVAEGQYPASGALLIGPDTPLSLLGISDRCLLNAAFASVEAPPKKKKGGRKKDAQPKKRPRNVTPVEGVGASAKAGKSRKKTMIDSEKEEERSPPLSVSLPSSSWDTLAMRFLHVGSGSEDSTLLGSRLASHMHTTMDGQARAGAALKGLVTVTDVGGPGGKTIDVAFRTRAGAAVSKERVQRLTPYDCVEVTARILVRNSGSKRRLESLLAKHGGVGPSTKILSMESVATRSPELFWAIYDHSRSSRAEEGDVSFGLEYLTKAARDKFEKLVEEGPG